MDENNQDLITLDELDDDPALTVSGRNFFGWGTEIRFFDVHFAYKNFWRRKREVPYNLIKSVKSKGGKIYIKVAGRVLPIVFAVPTDAGGICNEIKKIAGVK